MIQLSLLGCLMLLLLFLYSSKVCLFFNVSANMVFFRHPAYTTSVITPAILCVDRIVENCGRLCLLVLQRDYCFLQP